MEGPMGAYWGNVHHYDRLEARCGPCHTKSEESTVNIGLLCSEYPTISPFHGGIGSATQTMARELVRRGHHATVYAKGETDLSFTDDSVRTVTIGRNRGLLNLLNRMLKMRRSINGILGRAALTESPSTQPIPDRVSNEASTVKSFI